VRRSVSSADALAFRFPACRVPLFLASTDANALARSNHEAWTICKKEVDIPNCQTHTYSTLSPASDTAITAGCCCQGTANAA
jgi:hypothetical protein